MTQIKTFSEFLNEQSKDETPSKSSSELQKIAREIKSIIDDFKEFGDLASEPKYKNHVKSINDTLKQQYKILSSRKKYDAQEVIEQLMAVKDLMSSVKFGVDEIRKDHVKTEALDKLMTRLMKVYGEFWDERGDGPKLRTSTKETKGTTLI